MSYKVTEEDWEEKSETFRIVIVGKGKKKYKQIKRILDLLRMKWFE